MHVVFLLFKNSARNTILLISIELRKAAIQSDASEKLCLKNANKY